MLKVLFVEMYVTTKKNEKKCLFCFWVKLSEIRSCAKVAVDVLGSPSPISLTVSVDVSNTETETVKLFVAYNAMSLTRVR